ncbi:DUF1622 domain-containing protein [Kitasatospora sp. NPDC089913]|uniref:DUF1622 domain-containing protein n=1 Tax=Streptomycetaceae TaxID=2062 RepID=UPI000879990D|nr:DUF1622 domain-containing protein [Streptomyces sp. TLI_053]SDT82488.1 Uncharacterized membrane protein [Streptomyces sp. TLI_053]
MDDFLSESTLHDIVDLFVRLVEFAGALIIFVGALWAFVRFVLFWFRPSRPAAPEPGPLWDFTRIRLGMGRFLVLGLEFQLAGDILRTAVAPTFTEIGQLGAIAAIRTALNYFLGKELREERAEIERSAAGPVAARTTEG